jgi:adenosylcobinamide-GDP ribazoletransferase
MNSLFHAIAFLSRLPVPRLSSSKEDWENSAAYYPVVGAIMGFLLFAVALLLEAFFPPPLSTVLILVFWVYLTGGLHLDGWMDLADGLGSNRPKEKVLEIMKDSRVGAMGVIAAILLFMIKGAAIYQLQTQHLLAFIILPLVLARFFLVLALRFWPYISQGGLGNGLRAQLTGWKIGLGFLFTISIVVVGFSINGVIVLLTSVFIGWLFVRYIVKRLGGLTGDCYGAIVEWVEAGVLILIVLVER